MANGQFVIPGTLENEEIRRLVDGAFQESAATVKKKPEQRTEYDSEPPYSDIIDIQVDLESLRAFADPVVWKNAMKKGMTNGL